MKKAEREFLIELRDKFKKLPLESIDQGVSSIRNKRNLERTITCGCFGAWISKFYDIESPYYAKYTDTEFSFREGEVFFEEMVSKKTILDLEQITNEELFGLFSWSMHPSDAIDILLKQEKEVMKQAKKNESI